jgi:hypothetical protein
MGALVGAGVALLGQLGAMYGQWLVEQRRIREDRAGRWELVQPQTYERFVAAAMAYHQEIQRAAVEGRAFRDEIRGLLHDATAALLISGSIEVQQPALKLRRALYGYATFVEDQRLGRDGHGRPDWMASTYLPPEDWYDLREALVETIREERRRLVGNG